MSKALPATVTVADVAAAFRVHPKTVYRWVKNGKLPKPSRVAGWLRWRADQIERLLGPKTTTARRPGRSQRRAAC